MSPHDYHPLQHEGPVPSTQGAAPDSGEAFTPNKVVSTYVSDAAKYRAKGWEIATKLLAPPTPHFVEKLRNGEIVSEIRSSISWLEGEADRFNDVLEVFDTFVEQTSKKQVEILTLALENGYQQTWPNGVPWLSTFAELSGMIDAESEAWADLDHARAKELRVAQQPLIESKLVNDLPPWVADAQASHTPLVYRTAARFALLYLSFESGRDIESAMRSSLPALREN